MTKVNKKKWIVKTATYFCRNKNTRSRYLLARLIDAIEEDEPMLVRGYQAEILPKSI